MSDKKETGSYLLSKASFQGTAGLGILAVVIAVKQHEQNVIEFLTSYGFVIICLFLFAVGAIFLFSALWNYGNHINLKYPKVRLCNRLKKFLFW